MKFTIIIKTAGNLLHEFVNGEHDVSMDADNYSLYIADDFADAIAYLDTNNVDYTAFTKTLVKK